MLNFNFLQFREILGILPNTIAQAATSFVFGFDNYLLLPAIEIPKWFEFNHHQSVGNSVSFLVGPKFLNLVVCIAIPSKDIGCKKVNIFVNDEISFTSCTEVAIGNYDHVWLCYGKVNISNPSKENRIEVEVRDLNQYGRKNISLNRMRIYAECICCPQKPNISLASSMDQCAFNNGEEASGRVGIRRRLRKRNHRPTHTRRPQKHYLRWLRVRYQLWKPSSKPGDGELPMGFMIRVHLQSPIPFSMMIPMPICIHHQRRQKHVDPTLKRRFASFYFSKFKGLFIGL